jgi:hypothetical protein
MYILIKMRLNVHDVSDGDRQLRRRVGVFA